MAAKTILFCADGTWNGPGEDNVNDPACAPTNVFKLFTSLAGTDAIEQICLSDEQERSVIGPAGETVQIAKYLHGVGDSKNFLAKLLGGALGAGIISRIVRGYTFISRNYVPGDRIVLVGFSRGAYTARALGGLITAKGLLDAATLPLDDERDDAYRLGAAVWYAWRQQALQAKPDWLANLQETILDLPAFVSQPPTVSLTPPPPIEAIAVWDTVGSLGIPNFAHIDEPLDAFRFVGTALNALVQHGIHAVATDEQRENFVPTLWDNDPRIVQLLWPGSHADVGGGYPLAGGESRVSDASLAWLMDRLTRLGVLFSATPAFKLDPDSTGIAHRAWTYSPFNVLPFKPRVFPPGLMLSAGLTARLAAGNVVPDPAVAAEAYAPTTLAGALAYVAD